jgi:small subunit ribosomal protein S6
LFGSLADIVSPSSSSSSSLEPKPSVECPPGLSRYETMAVLRPDITEQQRLELTQRYEEVSENFVISTFL